MILVEDNSNIDITREMMKDKKTDFDIYIHWNITQECNFSCSYCVVNATHAAPKEIDVDRIIQRLNRSNKTLFISFSGGEPFMVPNFTELNQELTKKHRIRIDTNLSLKDECIKFANIINPDKVLEICFSAHVLEWEKRPNGLDELCCMVKMFQAKGFKMIGKYVAYPPLMERMEKDIDFFDSRGIKILPSYFWGVFNGKRYPVEDGRISYSEEELRLIEKLNPHVRTQLQKVRNNFCQAGCAAFTINQDYEVLMCDRIQKKLGDFFGEWNLLPKVVRCTKMFCTCPLNRAPSITLFRFDYPPVAILRKAISEKGTYSLLESYRVIEGPILFNMGKRILRKILQLIGARVIKRLLIGLKKMAGRLVVVNLLYPDRYVKGMLRMDDTLEKIRKKEPFAFMKFADGEYLLMVPPRHSIKARDGWIIPARMSKLGKALRLILNFRGDDVYFATSTRPIYTYSVMLDYWYLTRIRQKRKYITEMVLPWAYRDYARFLKIVKAMSEPVILFANKRGKISNFPWPVKEFYGVTDDVVQFFEEHDSGFIEDVRSMAKKYNNTLFVACAGPLANIIAYEGWKANPTNRYINAGSVFDEFLFGRKTSPYQK